MNKETQRYFSTTSRRCSVATPKPLDFDAFIPWICNEFEISCDIIVKRIVQDDYTPSKSQHRTSKTKSHLHQNVKDEKDFKISAKKSNDFNKFIDRCIPLTTYYDSKGRLLEIAILSSPTEISRKLFTAVSLCVPFHPSLTKVTICKRGLGLPALFEFSKLLSHSNITEVFIEDCYLPDATYELLLERACNLKHLSLRRLSINDTTCVRIAKTLDLGEKASKTLLTLDLTSNNINDKGAKAFGEILRTNRSLLHLNLSNNHITDIGAGSILDSLTMFPLTIQEILDHRKRKFEYYIKKMAVYKKNIKLIHEENKIEDTKESRRIKNVDPAETVKVLADQLTIDEVDDFNDVFSNDYVSNINNMLYCDGNLRLCSLNLAYNNLTYISIRKIYDALLYQTNTLSKVYKMIQTTGLIRIVIDGNDVPLDCHELKGINDILCKILSDRCDTKHVSVHGSSIKSINRLKSTKSIRKKKSIANTASNNRSSL